MCGYILHDARTTSRDRILWNETRNLISKADDAWFEMFATARDQAALKQHSGQSARGRKNISPVLHLTLSWAQGESPTPEHMRETALSSLDALGLAGHQALLAAHSDKQHLHVHIVVNTIHPETGMTAALKYSKERLSRWAEAYEKEHGIHIEQRIRNNQRRKEVSSAREQDPSIPFEPVKNKQTARKDWIEQQEILDRMKELRSEIRPTLQQPSPQDRKILAMHHRAERDAYYQNARGAVQRACSAVFTRRRPQWRDLYRVHKKESARLREAHPFERAVYVYTQRNRLGNGKPLTVRQMFNLIIKPDRLLNRVETIQAQERASLARSEKTEKKQVSDRLWQNYKAGIEKIRERQKTERFALVSEREATLRSIVTPELAKEKIIAERQMVSSPSQQFGKAVDAHKEGHVREVEKIKRQMEEWRRRNQDRDFGREM